jgi:AcrR family transcriptional regulator
MARPIAATHAIKRDDMLDRAAELFAAQGYVAATMQGLADACGLSKATRYHYYPTKDALLFDLLDRYTQRLLVIVAEAEAAAQRQGLDERAALHTLLRLTLAEYESAATRHAVLLNETRHLPEVQRHTVQERQRNLVAAFARFLRRAYPQRVTAQRATAHTMMLFGMINWTFTWLKPNGPMSYGDFADLVVETLESGLNSAPGVDPRAKRDRT